MRVIVSCCAAALLLGLCGHGTAAESVRRPLSLQEAIQLALRHNLDLQIERLNPEIARYRLGSAYGAAYDPVLGFTAREDFVDMPAMLDPKKTTYDEAYELTTDVFGPTLTGRLPTGLTYDLSGSAEFWDARTDFGPAWARVFPPAGVRATNEYRAAAAIQLRQPLLKDFWIDSDRHLIRMEKKNLKISEWALRQQVMNTIARVQLAYYELTYARDRIRVQEQALNLAQQLSVETRKRVEFGELPPLDEKQAESQVETVQADLLAAQQTLAEQQNALKILLTDDFRSWADVDVEPSDPLVALPASFNREEGWRIALELRPDIQQLRLESEKQDVVVRYRHNQLFPSLDLVGGYGGRSVEDSLGGAVAALGDADYPAYSYGVVLSIPLSNKSARNNYKASQAARKQTQLQLRKLEQEILVQVDNAARLAQSQYQRVNATRQARLFAEAALEAEQKKLRSGITISFVVLELQRNLTAARSAEIRALADYSRASAQLAFSQGSTLERNQIQLDIR